MMHGKAARVLGSFSLAGLVCCAAMLGTGAARAGDMPPRVDSTQPNAEPVYPDSARAAGEAGTILIDVLVKSTGRAAQYRVAQSSGYGDLDAAAVQTVLNWRYLPATHHGDTVSDWTTVKVVYQLPQTADGTSAPPQH
ncbi:MAG TPA: energy transducer TonB [Rhizomicrobium sp.]|jgi:protein TonB|nr:energy transducer TonB [Rhizomicrobium sp.]